jgi:hypothetical protein
MSQKRTNCYHTGVSLEPQVIEYLNDLARRMGMNRSWVLNTIVYEYAKMMEDKDIRPWLGRFQPQKAGKALEVNS